LEEASWNIWTVESERESKTVSDGEKLFGDNGKRIQIVHTVVIVVFVADDEIENRFPTLVR
jgi:hypothetical protein